MKNIIRKIFRKLLRYFTIIKCKDKNSIKCKKNIESIAYFIWGGIGDGVISYSSVNFIKQHYSNVELTVFVPKFSYNILKIIYKDFNVFPLNLGIFFIRLFKKKYDVGITNTVSVFSVFIEYSTFLLCKESYGFHYPNENDNVRAYTYTKPILNNAHDANQNIQLVADILDINGINYFDYLYKKSLDNKSKKICIIHPGAQKNYEYKIWPVENFVLLAESLLKKGFDVNIILGNSEQGLKQYFVLLKNIKILDSLNGSDFIRKIKSSSLFIGNDSGPAHIASFYNIPTIVLFGPTDPIRTSPLSQNAKVIYKKTDCSPCHFSQRSCFDNICMKSIEVKNVLDLVKDYINN